MFVVGSSPTATIKLFCAIEKSHGGSSQLCLYNRGPMAKENLRAHPLGYSVVIVDGYKDPRHPALADLRRYKETQLIQNMPDCIFGDSLFSYGIVMGTYFILLNEDSEIIGYAWGSPEGHAFYLRHLCTNTLKYKGAGTILMNAVIARAKKDGFRRITLDALEEAVPFYERMGFHNRGMSEDELYPMILRFSEGGTRKKRRTRRCRR